MYNYNVINMESIEYTKKYDFIYDSDNSEEYNSEEYDSEYYDSYRESLIKIDFNVKMSPDIIKYIYYLKALENKLYRREHICEAKKRQGKCVNKAIYIHKNRLLCSYHRNRKVSVKLPLNPDIIENDISTTEKERELYRGEFPCESFQRNGKCLKKASYVCKNRLLCSYHRNRKYSVKLPLRT